MQRVRIAAERKIIGYLRLPQQRSVVRSLGEKVFGTSELQSHTRIRNNRCWENRVCCHGDMFVTVRICMYDDDVQVPL